MEKDHRLCGRKFFMLLAEKIDSETETRVYYDCLCDCGDRVIKSDKSLRENKKISCGCTRGNTKSLVGQKIDALQILDNVKGKRSRYEYYICECECGKIVERTAATLNAYSYSSCGCKNKHANEDIIGFRIGNLIVGEFSHKGHEGRYFFCKCDCGNETIKLYTDLQDYIRLNKKPHCNHINCKYRKMSCKRNKDIGRVPFKFFSRIRATAKYRELDFDLTHEFLSELFESQNGKCKISGLPMVFENDIEARTASLDRINSSKGYIKGNVQFLHPTVNIMKMDNSDQELINLCHIISEYQNYRG